MITARIYKVKDRDFDMIDMYSGNDFENPLYVSKIEYAYISYYKEKKSLLLKIVQNFNKDESENSAMVRCDDLAVLRCNRILISEDAQDNCKIEVESINAEAIHSKIRRLELV